MEACACSRCTSVMVCDRNDFAVYLTPISQFHSPYFQVRCVVSLLVSCFFLHWDIQFWEFKRARQSSRTQYLARSPAPENCRQR